MKPGTTVKQRKSTRLSAPDRHSDEGDGNSPSMKVNTVAETAVAASRKVPLRNERSRSRPSKLGTSVIDLSQDDMPDSFMPHVDGTFAPDGSISSLDLQDGLQVHEEDKKPPLLPYSSDSVIGLETSSPDGEVDGGPPNGMEDTNSFGASGSSVFRENANRQPSEIPDGSPHNLPSLDGPDDLSVIPPPLVVESLVLSGTATVAEPDEPTDLSCETFGPIKREVDPVFKKEVEAPFEQPEEGQKPSCAHNAGEIPSPPKAPEPDEGDSDEMPEVTWADFYTKCLEDTLESYVTISQEQAKKIAELTREVTTLKQQILRLSRRTGPQIQDSPASIAGGPISVAARENAGEEPSSVQPKLGGAEAGGALVRSTKRVLENAFRGSSMVPRSLKDKSTPTPAKSTSQDDLSLPSTSALRPVSGDTTGVENGSTGISRDHSLKGRPREVEKMRKKLLRSVTAWSQAPEAEVGPPGLVNEPSIAWFVEKPPMPPDSKICRRSQGPAWRTDVMALMALEPGEQTSMARMCQRGEVEEKRRIRWDMRAKREKAKRCDSETREVRHDDLVEKVEDRRSTRGTRHSSGKASSEGIAVKRSKRLLAAGNPRTSTASLDIQERGLEPLKNFVFLGNASWEKPGIPKAP